MDGDASEPERTSRPLPGETRSPQQGGCVSPGHPPNRRTTMTQKPAFKKASKSSSKLRAALFGPSGAGKTFTALRIATGLGGPIAVDRHRARLGVEVRRPLHVRRAGPGAHIDPGLPGGHLGRGRSRLRRPAHRQPVPRLAGPPAGSRSARQRQVPGQHLVGLVRGHAQAAGPGGRHPHLPRSRHRDDALQDRVEHRGHRQGQDQTGPGRSGTGTGQGHRV